MNTGSTGTKFRFKITICHRLNVCWAYPLMLHLIPLINCWITWSGRKKNMPETEKIRVCVSTWQTRSAMWERWKMKSGVWEQLWSHVSWRCSSCFRLQEVSLPSGSSPSGATEAFYCFLLFCRIHSAALSRGGGEDSAPVGRGRIPSAGAAFSLCYLSLWPHYSWNSTKIKSLDSAKQQ